MLVGGVRDLPPAKCYYLSVILSLCSFIKIFYWCHLVEACRNRIEHGLLVGYQIVNYVWVFVLNHSAVLSLLIHSHVYFDRSFLCGGSTGLFIYGYCLYYYHARSDMSGFMQTTFFFGYMACICYGFFLMLGTVGFRAALLFVRHIYRSIKCEWLLGPIQKSVDSCFIFCLVLVTCRFCSREVLILFCIISLLKSRSRIPFASCFWKSMITIWVDSILWEKFVSLLSLDTLLRQFFPNLNFPYPLTTPHLGPFSLPTQN